MNTNPDRVLITNYDQILEYFKHLPDHIYDPVSNTESRPISPPNDYDTYKNRSAKWHLKHLITQLNYHTINCHLLTLSYYNTKQFGMDKVQLYLHMLMTYYHLPYTS